MLLYLLLFSKVSSVYTESFLVRDSPIDILFEKTRNGDCKFELQPMRQVYNRLHTDSSVRFGRTFDEHGILHRLASGKRQELINFNENEMEMFATLVSTFSCLRVTDYVKFFEDAIGHSEKSARSRRRLRDLTCVTKACLLKVNCWTNVHLNSRTALHRLRCIRSILRALSLVRVL